MFDIIKKNAGGTAMSKKKIGVVVAIEIDAVLSKYGQAKETIEKNGFAVHIYENEKSIMYVLLSGAGEIAAAAGTQFLITEFDVDMILNFGAVGALTAEMATAELCAVEKVIHYDLDTSNWLNLPRGQYPDQPSAYVPTDEALLNKALELCPSLKKVTCASADKFVDSAEDKAKLHLLYEADICEMEAAGVVLTCSRNKIPCLLIKAVSDSLIGGGKEFLTELNRVSVICFDVVDKIINSLV